ncbi:MAG: hypothetical protein HZA50_07110 [Planctomycetes bacterium]|nr:hypothetical protein [Planctomycetota bacterium]
MLRTAGVTLLFGAVFALVVLGQEQPATDKAKVGFVWWEGENYTKTDFPTTDALAKGGWYKAEPLSAGKWFGATSLPAGAFLEYEVDVPRDGTYKFFARRFWKHGPFKWRFGEGAWVDCGKSSTLLDGAGEELAKNICVNWVSLGDVKLNAGKTTFRLEQSEAGNACYDCFVLVDGSFTPTGSLKPDGSGGRAATQVAATAPGPEKVAVTPPKPPDPKPADTKPPVSAISAEFARFKADRTIKADMGDLIKFVDFDRMIDQQADALKLDDARKEKAKLTDEQKEKMLKIFQEKLDGLKDGTPYAKAKANIENAVKGAAQTDQIKKLRTEYDNKFFGDAFKLLTPEQKSIFYTARLYEIVGPEFNVLLLTPDQDAKLRTVCAAVAKKIAGGKAIDLSADQGFLNQVKLEIAKQVLTPPQITEWQKNTSTKKP